jgi:adenosine/AMP kinase
LSIKNESNDGEGVRISNDTSLKIAKNHIVKILVKKIHGNGLNILKT